MGHYALFYSERAQLWESCQRFLHNESAGASWLYVADEHSAEIIPDPLRSQGRASFIDSAELSFRDSPIRIQPIITSLQACIETHLLSAPQLTIFIEMSWAIRTPSGAVYLREYEAAIEQLCDELPITIVCIYNQQIMLDRQLLIGLHTHRRIITSGGLVDNPYYVPPVVFAGRNLRQQFDHWLQRLDPAATPADDPLPARTGNSYHLSEEPMLVARNSDEGRWKIRCFGGLRVYRADGSLIEWNTVSGATRKTKTLFGFLLFRGESGATAEEIADLLWPDSAESRRSLNRLYHTVRCLRRALSPELKSGRHSPFVLLQDQRYFLALPPNSWIDLPMFEELCYRGRALMKQANWHEALLCYQSAERLYTGDLLADVPEKYTTNRDIDWCWSRRYWYRQMYVKLLVNSAEIHRVTNDVPAALTACDRALQADPANESAHQEKMRTLASVNRWDAVERQHRLYRNALKQFDLGVPSPTFEQFVATLNESAVPQP